MIPSKHVGYVLRILGQNPTEDEIVAMVMKVSQIMSSPQIFVERIFNRGKFVKQHI